MNPYYNPKDLDLEMLCFDEPNMSYEYNTLCFWLTKKGHIYTMSDCGCSCPTPFENHDRMTQEEVLKTLTRIDSLEQAQRAFDTWNKPYDGKKIFGPDDRRKLTLWVKKNMKL